MDQKLAPYQRLKSILTDGNPLSEKGSNNLDEILGIEKKQSRENFIDNIIRIFKKIDSFIFKKPDKIANNPYRRKR